MDAAFQNKLLPAIHEAADQLSKALTAEYPPEELLAYPGLGAVPKAGAEDLAWALTEVVAEVLQSYLNAGSESDAIHENLGPHIEAEVMDWTQ